MALRLAPVLVSVIVTLAFGTAASEESVIVPTSDAVTAWESATLTSTAASRRRRQIQRRCCIYEPPVCFPRLDRPAAGEANAGQDYMPVSGVMQLPLTLDKQTAVP